MSQDIINPASAINLADISAHPTEALAALIEVVRLQGDEIRHLQENQSIQATLIAKLKSRICQISYITYFEEGEIKRAIYYK